MLIEPSHSYSHEDHQKCLQDNPVLLYMKGTPKEPRCGFSQSVVRILNQCGVTFTSINVLDPDIRAALKKITGWPTFPQLYIRIQKESKLIGGHDIIVNLYEKGELQEKLKQAH